MDIPFLSELFQMIAMIGKYILGIIWIFTTSL